MTTPDPVQQTILKAWGITPLVGKSDDPEHALTDFWPSSNPGWGLRAGSVAPQEHSLRAAVVPRLGARAMNVAQENAKSLWMDIEVAQAPALSGGQTVDVVVIGSGIAGLSTAYE